MGHGTDMMRYLHADARAAMDLALYEQQKGPTLGLDAPQLQVLVTCSTTFSLPAMAICTQSHTGATAPEQH